VLRGGGLASNHVRDVALGAVAFGRAAPRCRVLCERADLPLQFVDARGTVLKNRRDARGRLQLPLLGEHPAERARRFAQVLERLAQHNERNRELGLVLAYGAPQLLHILLVHRVVAQRRLEIRFRDRTDRLPLTLKRSERLPRFGQASLQAGELVAQTDDFGERRAPRIRRRQPGKPHRRPLSLRLAVARQRFQPREFRGQVLLQARRSRRRPDVRRLRVRLGRGNEQQSAGVACFSSFRKRNLDHRPVGERRDRDAAFVAGVPPGHRELRIADSRFDRSRLQQHGRVLARQSAHVQPFGLNL
jgi:hypothetical protein